MPELMPDGVGSNADTANERLVLVTSYGLSAYLERSPFIDFGNPAVVTLARRIRGQDNDKLALVRRAFEMVRDEFPHSWDVQRPVVTASASQVVREGTGICYAKAHLLAALLRANGIPAGLAYQRLKRRSLAAPSTSHCIHGLTTVFLEEVGGWRRIDARGNRPGLSTAFNDDGDTLAFQLEPANGELDYRTNHSEPHPLIVRTLKSNTDAMHMYRYGLLTDLPGEAV